MYDDYRIYIYQCIYIMQKEPLLYCVSVRSANYHPLNSVHFFVWFLCVIEYIDVRFDEVQI